MTAYRRVWRGSVRSRRRWPAESHPIRLRNAGSPIGSCAACCRGWQLQDSDRRQTSRINACGGGGYPGNADACGPAPHAGGRGHAAPCHPRESRARVDGVRRVDAPGRQSHRLPRFRVDVCRIVIQVTALQQDALRTHRQQLGGLLGKRLFAATSEANRYTADSALDIFGECVERYQAVAQAADGHANDAVTLDQAWPVSD